MRAITEEMAITLLHTTRSPILSEGRDFSTGLYRANGDMLEQTEYTALLGFALQPSLKACIRYFGEDSCFASSRLRTRMRRSSSMLG